MSAELVLFLRDAVPRSTLLAALADVLGMSAGDEDDALTLVDYSEGFALGVGIEPGARRLQIPEAEAAQALADRLRTPVLLESEPAGSSRWLLFEPGVNVPQEAEVLELRHGLTAVGVSLPFPHAADLACASS